MAGLLLVLALPAGAAAHAELVTSTPDDGAVVAAPAEVVLTFDEAVVEGSSFCRARRDRLDGRDRRSRIRPTPRSCGRPFRLSGPGAYEVQWTSVAEDADVERGTFRFTIAEPTPVPPTPTPVPERRADGDAHAIGRGHARTVAASPTPSATVGGGADSGTDVLLPILAVVVLVAVGLAVDAQAPGPGVRRGPARAAGAFAGLLLTAFAGACRRRRPPAVSDVSEPAPAGRLPGRRRRRRGSLVRLRAGARHSLRATTR